MRGTGANQTTDQIGLLSLDTLDLAEDIDDTADANSIRELARRLDGWTGRVRRAPWAEPLHINVQLAPPLTPTDRWLPAEPTPPSVARWRHDGTARLDRGPATVVVAGDDAGSRARVLAQRGGWPLLAEPTSGARTGDHALRCYRLLLDGELGERIERVVVCGHPTLSRPVTRLLARDDVEVLSAPAPGRWPRRPFPVARALDTTEIEVAREPGPEEQRWLEAWRTADRELSRRLDRLLADRPELTPHEVSAVVGRAVPAGGLLVVGASSPIRDLDLMLPPAPVQERRKIVANRGLAGIDGVVSTAIGAALARPSSRALALLGDVTFLHDSNGLVLGPREPRPDLTLVVVNDDGGSIFSMLEQGAPEYADRFDALFGTPHGVDLAHLCAATRTPHLRVGSLPELQQALASPNGGIEVIEARVRRDDRRELDAAIRALADRT